MKALATILFLVLAGTAQAELHRNADTIQGRVTIDVGRYGVRVAVDRRWNGQAPDGIFDDEFVLFMDDASTPAQHEDFGHAIVTFWPEKLVVRSITDHKQIILAIRAPQQEVGPSIQELQDFRFGERAEFVSDVYEQGYGLRHTTRPRR